MVDFWSAVWITVMAYFLGLVIGWLRRDRDARRSRSIYVDEIRRLTALVAEKSQPPPLPKEEPPCEACGDPNVVVEVDFVKRERRKK